MKNSWAMFFIILWPDCTGPGKRDLLTETEMCLNINLLTTLCGHIVLVSTRANSPPLCLEITDQKVESLHWEQKYFVASQIVKNILHCTAGYLWCGRMMMVLGRYKNTHFLTFPARCGNTALLKTLSNPLITLTAVWVGVKRNTSNLSLSLHHRLRPKKGAKLLDFQGLFSYLQLDI